MSNALFLPGNERELVDTYLDRALFSALAEKYDRLQENDNSDTAKDMRKQVFHAAMRSFANSLCERQCGICEQAYWKAPCGEEAEYINSAPMPDLCADTEAYDTMERWWLELSLEQKLDIAGAYEGIFSPIYDMTISDEDLDSEVDEKWSELAVDDKFLIYEKLKDNSDALQK